MATLTCADWLAAWERSLAAPPPLRPCALLAPLFEEGQDAAERLSVGRRDACLLDLHQALFGPAAEALATCPQCAEPLELSLDLGTLRLPAPEEGAQDGTEQNGTNYPLVLRTDDCLLRMRLPDSRDLAAIAACADGEAARRRLVERCVHAEDADGRALPAVQLPPALIEQAARVMADADPQAVVELVLACPACGHAWNEPFDIGRFLLAALDHWAERLLDTVHALAHAYGWSEGAILALTPARRARYLARVAA